MRASKLWSNATSSGFSTTLTTKRESTHTCYSYHKLYGGSVGCKLVENNSWPNAPVTIPIIGLKELPQSADPLPHTHIHFAHCYKRQAGWSAVLTRFHRGGGTLYDLEFLNDPHGRRVAAFGFYAGFAGAAAGALALAAQKRGEKLGRLEPFDNEHAMVSAVKEALGGSGKGTKALVIGALGRCGRGAVDLFRKIGLEEYVYCRCSKISDF
jgi:saccharopine dehydrogenase (NAD+, L-lysine-forming)